MYEISWTLYIATVIIFVSKTLAFYLDYSHLGFQLKKTFLNISY